MRSQGILRGWLFSVLEVLVLVVLSPFDFLKGHISNCYGYLEGPSTKLVLKPRQAPLRRTVVHLGSLSGFHVSLDRPLLEGQLSI